MLTNYLYILDLSQEVLLEEEPDSKRGPDYDNRVLNSGHETEKSKQEMNTEKIRDLKKLVPPPPPCPGATQSQGYVNVPSDIPSGGTSKHGYVNVPDAPPPPSTDWLNSSVPVGVQRKESKKSPRPSVSGLDAIVDTHEGPSEDYISIGEEGQSQSAYHNMAEDIGPSEYYMTMGGQEGPTENYMAMDSYASRPDNQEGPTENYMAMDSFASRPDNQEGPTENYMAMDSFASRPDDQEGPTENYMAMDSFASRPGNQEGPTENYMSMDSMVSGPGNQDGPTENYMSMDSMVSRPGDQEGPTENYMSMDSMVAGPDEHYMNFDSPVVASSPGHDVVGDQPSYIAMDEPVDAPQECYLPMDGSVPPKGYMDMGGRGRTRLGGQRETVADVVYEDPNQQTEPVIVPKRAEKHGRMPKRRAETCHLGKNLENRIQENPIPQISIEPSMDDDVPISTEALIQEVQGKPKLKPKTSTSPTGSTGGEQGKRRSYVNNMFARQEEQDKVDYYAKTGGWKLYFVLCSMFLSVKHWLM